MKSFVGLTHGIGDWLLLEGELGPHGEKLTQILWEGGKGEPGFILIENSKLALKDLEVIYDGSEEDFAIATESAFFRLDNVTLNKPKV